MFIDVQDIPHKSFIGRWIKWMP